MSELIRIGDLARSVGLHENTIRSMVKRGMIPATVSDGGQRFFDLEKVQLALATIQAGKASRGSDGSVLWSQTLSLAGLSEDQVWRKVKSKLGAHESDGAADIMPFAFNEMLNNAIDHSQGETVNVQFSVTAQMWSFKISDNGLGVFENIKNGFGLESSLEAVAELTKGKRTTAPKAHSGEGIFFTSKAVDTFELIANGVRWFVDNRIYDFFVEEVEFTPGTTVCCTLASATTKRYIDVFQHFSVEHEFVRTAPVVKLFETGMSFLSRSEARRLMQGLEKFKEITLDCQKVNSVGQGFVDEIFRVWANDHPSVQIKTINAVPAVEFMIQRGVKLD